MASTIAAAPIIRIPVPKKKDEATEIPKYLLKMNIQEMTVNVKRPFDVRTIPSTLRVNGLSILWVRLISTIMNHCPSSNVLSKKPEL